MVTAPLYLVMRKDLAKIHKITSETLLDKVSKKYRPPLKTTTSPSSTKAFPAPYNLTKTSKGTTLIHRQITQDRIQIQTRAAR